MPGRFDDLNKPVQISFTFFDFIWIFSNVCLGAVVIAIILNVIDLIRYEEDTNTPSAIFARQTGLVMRPYKIGGAIIAALFVASAFIFLVFTFLVPLSNEKSRNDFIQLAENKPSLDKLLTIGYDEEQLAQAKEKGDKAAEAAAKQAAAETIKDIGASIATA